MDISLYLARGWGILTVLIAFALLLNERRFVGQIKAFSEEYPLVLVAGVIAMAMGAFQVAGYNSWTLDYRGLVTAFGWLALLKGAALTLAPSRYLARFTRLIANERWYNGGLVVLLVMGAYLLYVGLG